MPISMFAMTVVIANEPISLETAGNKTEMRPGVGGEQRFPAKVVPSTDTNGVSLENPRKKTSPRSSQLKVQDQGSRDPDLMWQKEIAFV